MNIADIRVKLNEARKTGKATEMSLLQVVIGEATTIESRNGKISDGEIDKIVRKVVANNNEAMNLVTKSLIKSVLGEDPIDLLTLEPLSTTECLKLIAEKAVADSVVGALLTNRHTHVQKLTTENQFLESLLPQLLSREQIKENLTDIVASLREAKSNGQATGIAVKLLKSKALSAGGDDVSAVVQEIRLS